MYCYSTFVFILVRFDVESYSMDFYELRFEIFVNDIYFLKWFVIDFDILVYFYCVLSSEVSYKVF